MSDGKVIKLKEADSSVSLISAQPTFSCDVNVALISINPIQPFSSIAADIDASIDAYMGEDEMCFMSSEFLPSPIWGNVDSFSWGSTTLAGSSQFEAIKMMFSTGLTSLENIGVTLPEFPEIEGLGIEGLGIDFSGLFPVDWAALAEGADITALKAALSSILPSPLYGNVSSPSQEIMDYIQTALNNYMTVMATFMMSVISLVTDLVSSLDSGDVLGGLPELELPEMPNISAMTTLDELASITFFPFTMGANTTIICPPYDFAQACKNFPTTFAAGCLSMILDFWVQVQEWAEEVLVLPDIIPVPFELPIPMLLGKKVYA